LNHQNCRCDKCSLVIPAFIQEATGSGKERQNFYPYGHYKVIHGVPYQYLANFIAMYSKEGKVHLRTGHKGPEGE